MKPLMHDLATLLSGVLILVLASSAGAEEALVLNARQRDKQDGAVKEKVLRWEAKKTALIICDVWDQHWCQSANRRVAEMAPRMNQVAAAARARGVLIIHAPSDCMDYYKDTPQRKLAQSAPPAKDAPAEIGKWCSKLPEEPALPVDASDGGCDCTPQCAQRRAWKGQLPAIGIAEPDAITDRGQEVWNLLQSRGIDNVIILGVHTNMCVLGRPFGLRNLWRYGKNVVLVRDLTDTMYNPRQAPFVSHARGTELVIEHIERQVCPSILAADLLR